jgi:hypothetical protein
MKQGKPKGDTIRTGFIPGETWMAAKEVEHFAPGATVTVDGDDIAFPKPFSQAPAGEWHYMAILDVDHSYARNGAGPGDLVSAVATGPKLNLSRVNPPRAAPADTATVKLVEFDSPLLSRFLWPAHQDAGWGRPASRFRQARSALSCDLSRSWLWWRPYLRLARQTRHGVPRRARLPRCQL